MLCPGPINNLCTLSMLSIYLSIFFTFIYYTNSFTNTWVCSCFNMWVYYKIFFLFVSRQKMLWHKIQNCYVCDKGNNVMGYGHRQGTYRPVMFFLPEHRSWNHNFHPLHRGLYGRRIVLEFDLTFGVVLLHKLVQPY